MPCSASCAIGGAVYALNRWHQTRQEAPTPNLIPVRSLKSKRRSSHRCLTFILTFAVIATVYWFWIRPILKSRPELRELYQREESFFAALREKLKGIKQKLSSAIVIAASAAVSGYDFLEPIVSGVDVTSLYVPRAVLGLAADRDLAHRAVPVPAQPR